MLNKEELVKYYKSTYTKGSRVCLISMSGENMPCGLKGNVTLVDDLGNIHVNWENGSSLALVPGEDEWVLLV